jgi:ComF family protein
VDVLGSLLEVLFPAGCVGCGRPPGALCPACLARARPAEAAPPPAGLDWWVAAFAYEGAVREAVARIKYRNARSALSPLAVALQGVLLTPGPGPVDLITWPPTTPARRRERGFDQAEHLARRLGRLVDVPVQACLIRSAGPSQTGRTARERRVGPGFTAVAGNRPLAGRQILVVDDIATTGATLAAAARALRVAGAAGVAAATIARTPRRNRPPRGADRSPAAQDDFLGRRYHN